MEIPKLNILLLGPPMITFDGKPVKISRRQHRALFYFLASNLQPISRAEVCEIFWPDVSEATSRKYLREGLSRLKAEPCLNEVITTINEQLFIDFNKCYADTAEFDRIVRPLLSSHEMNSNGRLPDWMIVQFKHVMSQCRTARFLQGLQLKGSPGFERWLEFTDHSYNFSRIKIIDRLVDHYISIGDLDEAILWLGKSLETDRMDRDRNFLLLTCLRDKGLTKQMIDYVNYLEAQYRERDEPFPTEFASLREKAKNNPATAELFKDKFWPDFVETTTRFVGRQNIIEQLNQLMRKKGVVHLRGEIGSGRSGLIKEFFVQQAYQPRLIYSRANPMASRVPFQTLLETMQREIKLEEWNSISEEDQKTLISFVTHFIKELEGKRIPTSDDVWLPILEEPFNAFLRLMEKIAAVRPVLFILDDASWCDQASLTLIAFLIEHNFFKENGLCIIVTDLEEPNEFLNMVLSRQKRWKMLETITVEPLTIEETSHFIMEQLGKLPPPAFVERIKLLTGGNPYYLIECIRTMKNATPDIIAPGEDDQCLIPESIETLVNEKVNFLKPETIKILQAAAVLGNWFTPDVLDLMTDVEPLEFLSALEELKLAGFVIIDMEIKPGGGYRFSHDIERKIIESRLDPAHKRYLHLKAAEAIVELRGRMPELSSKLARHFEAASEPTRAVEFWMIAAGYARSHFSRQETYKAYNRSIELIKQYAHQFSVEIIYKAFSEWSTYTLDLDDLQTGEWIFQTCLEIGELRKEPLLVGTGLSGLGRIAGLRFEYSKAQKYFQRAIYHLQQAYHPGELVEAYARQGILYFMHDDYQKAEGVFIQGLAVAGEHSDTRYLDARINILTRECTIECFKGQIKSAHELALQMLEDSQYVNRRSSKLQANTSLAMTYYFNGRFQEAIDVCLSSRELSQNLRIRFWESLLDIILALAYLEIGILDKAWQHTNLAVEREKEYPLEKLFDQAIVGKGNIFLSLGQYDKALALYQSVIETGVQNSQSIDCYRQLGTCLVHLGKTEEGLMNINRAKTIAGSKGLTGYENDSKVSHLLISNELLNPRIAKQAEKMLKEMYTNGNMLAEIYAFQLKARAAELQEKPDSALENYEKALELSNTVSSVWLKLNVLSKIISLTGSSSPQGIKAQEQAERILDELAKNALTQPVQGMLCKFRKKWRKNP